MYQHAHFAKIATILMALMLSVGCSDGGDSNDTSQLATVGYGQFNDAQLEDMRDSDSPDAIYVIDLLKFKPQAAYEDGRTTALTGEEAYALYSSEEHPQRFGGDLVHSASISATTTGTEASGGIATWDRVEITRYPNRASYVEMYDDDEYQAALAHKDAGLDTAIILVSELTMSSTRDGQPPKSTSESIHLGELLKFKEAAQYEPAQEPAISGKDADLLYEKYAMRNSIKFGHTVPVGDFSIDGVLIGDGRTWDEFKLLQFPSRDVYDTWENGSVRQPGLVHREAGLEDSEILIGDPPTVNRLPEIPAAQSWRWHNMGTISAEERADLFTNWQLVTPVRTAQGSSTPREFVRDTIDPEDLFYEHDGVTRSIAEYITRASAAGLMVMHDGKVVLEHYGQGIGPESRFHIWSASKSFTSTLVAIAVQEGKIANLDDKVGLYAPQFENTAYGDTSIRHLLMMSSGIDFFHSVSSERPDRLDLYWDVVNQGMDLDEWVKPLTRRVPGGTDFNYILTDTHVLSAVLREVYDMPFVKVLETKLWQPGGFAGSATWGQNLPDSDGHALGHCCLSLRLQEFAHLGQFYLEDGMIDGQQVVPADWVDSVAQPQSSPFYSFQFWLPQDSKQEFYASGAFGNQLWIDTARGFLVARFGTQVGALDISSAEHVAAVRAIGDAVTGVTR